MGIGASLVLFAIGAILRFAVTVTTPGFNVHTIGVILMIVGGIGFLISLAFWSSWGGFGGWGGGRSSRMRRTTMEGPMGSSTATTREDQVSTY
jgi:hypothetical protein